MARWGFWSGLGQGLSSMPGVLSDARRERDALETSELQRQATQLGMKNTQQEMDARARQEAINALLNLPEAQRAAAAQRYPVLRGMTDFSDRALLGPQGYSDLQRSDAATKAAQASTRASNQQVTDSERAHKMTMLELSITPGGKPQDWQIKAAQELGMNLPIGPRGTFSDYFMTGQARANLQVAQGQLAAAQKSANSLSEQRDFQQKTATIQLHDEADQAARKAWNDVMDADFRNRSINMRNLNDILLAGPEGPGDKSYQSAREQYQAALKRAREAYIKAFNQMATWRRAEGFKVPDVSSTPYDFMEQAMPSPMSSIEPVGEPAGIANTARRATTWLWDTATGIR